jgi:hypothetical protein
MFVRRHIPLPSTPRGTPPRSKISSQGVAIKRRRVVVNALGPVRRKRRPVRFHPYKLFPAWIQVSSSLWSITFRTNGPEFNLLRLEYTGPLLIHLLPCIH